MKQLFWGIVLTIVGVGMCNAQPLAEHINFCMDGKTRNRIVDQPMDRNGGACAAIAAAGVVAGFLSGNDKLQKLILNSRQYQWSRLAAELACTASPQNQQYAIGLILACECHNDKAWNKIINNVGPTLDELRKFGSCGGHPQNLIEVKKYYDGI